MSLLTASQPHPGDTPVHGHISSTVSSDSTGSTGSTGPGAPIDELIDLYAVLGVDPVASDDELDQAFRVLVRRHHPDTRLLDASPAAAEVADRRLQQLLSAYAVLRNPSSRAIYDRQRARRASQPARQPAGPAPPSASPPQPLWRGSHPGVVSSSVVPMPAIRVSPVRWRRPRHGT